MPTGITGFVHLFEAKQLSTYKKNSDIYSFASLQAESCNTSIAATINKEGIWALPFVFLILLLFSMSAPLIIFFSITVHFY